jgi:spore coat protein D
VHLLIEEVKYMSDKNINKPGVQPIYCDPQYVYHDSYVCREIPVIHPIVHVNRQNIVNVPRHYTQPTQSTQVIDPGLPGKDQVCGCGRKPCGCKRPNPWLW